jgi:hypothetical protein
MSASLILAATITFAFDGLMMFQGGLDGKQDVVVVNDVNHDHDKPHIEIWRGSTVEPLLQFSLKVGDTVHLGVAAGQVVSSASYREHVPDLKNLIRRGKITLKNNPAVLTSIELPPGTLLPWRTFKEKVGFIQSNNEFVKYCMARMVVLQTVVAKPGTLAITHVDPPQVESYPLQDGDLVIVSNASPSTKNLHFPLYARLLDPTGRLGGMDVLDGDYCDTTEPELGVGMFSDFIQDALDRHISRTPNGDCGQVRNQGVG